jgi:outer membrane receptor for ferrienterochelin and colicins
VILTVLGITPPALAAQQQEPNETENLFELPLETLMNVEVTSASKKAESLYEAPSVMSVVPRKEIDAYGDRDLHQLLQRQPSIYTRDVFPYTDNVAGFRGDMSTVAEMHTLILFNGRPIRESAQGINVNMYKTFPLSILENVELIRGPGSVLYGSNAFTGVINLKPRIPETNEVSISTMIGSYDYYSSEFTAGGRAGELGYITAFRVAGQQGYPYNMTDMYGVYNEDDRQYKSYSGAAHLEHGNFTFDGFWSDYDAFALGVVPSWSNTHDSFRNKKLFLNAGYRIPFHERLSLEFNLTYNLQENYLSGYRPQMIGTNTSDFLGELTLFAEPLDNLNIVTGYLMEQRSAFHADNDEYQSIPSYRHEPKCFYFQGDYKFGNIVKVIAGLQWNKSSYGFADLISRYGIIITPNDNWGIKLLRGEAFRAPVTIETDLYDPPVLVGNSSIEPETITTYDAQLFYHDKKTYAAVTYFNSTLDQLINYDDSVSPMSYLNSGKQRFRGIEFEAKRFITPNWQVIGSFMHQENDRETRVNPTVVPKNMLKVGTAYNWNGGSLGCFLTHFGEPPQIYDSTIVNPKPKAVSLISMNLQLDVSKLLGLKKGQSNFIFKVENLLDDEIYVPSFAYLGTPNSFPYNAGRTWFAGLKIIF